MSTRIRKRTINLDSIPFDDLKHAYLQREKELGERLGPHAAKKVIRTCAGCGELFSARDMRTHPCPSGISYWRRIGWVWDPVTKKYKPPKDWKFDPVKRHYVAPEDQQR